MTRRPVYDERMVKCDYERKEQVWQSQLREVLMASNPEEIALLVEIGFHNSFSFETFKDEHLVKYFMRKLS